MLPPIKCFSCGELISIHARKFKQFLYEMNYDPYDIDQKDPNVKKFFEREDVDLDQLCCRKSLLCTIEFLTLIR